MKVYLVIFSVFINFSVLFGQQKKIDSLTLLFNKEKQDSTRVRLLQEIGVAAYFTDSKLARIMNDSLIHFSKSIGDKKYIAQGLRMSGTLYLLEGNYDKSEKKYLEAISILKKIGDKRLEAVLYGNLAGLYGRKRETKKSIELFKKSIKLNLEIGENFGNMNSYVNLGVLSGKSGNLNVSTDYYIKALKIAENKKNYHYIAYCNNKLANVYLELLRFNEVERHLKKALIAGEKEENKYSLGLTHSLYGWLYEARDRNYKKSYYHYLKSLKYNQDINNKAVMLTENYATGRSLVFLKDYEKAEKYILDGLFLADSLNIDESKTIGNLELGHLYISDGKLKKASTYLKKAEQLLKDDNKIELKNHFGRIAFAYEQQKQYKLAYKYLKTYTFLTDSLFQVNGVDRIVDIETKYQTEKKEKENLQLKADKVSQELQLEKENKRKQYFAFALLTSLFTLGIFIFYYRKNKKQKSVIENLQKDLHHRVKNNLAIIDSLVEDIKDEFNNKLFTTKLTDLQNRIDSINEVHSQLYMNTDITNLKLKKYVAKLAKNVQHSFAKENISIDNSIDDSITLCVEQSFPVGLIINEFLTNSFKYAFPDSTKKGMVKVSIQEKQKNYILSLSDNGMGLPNDFDISKLDSFGMDVMKLLSKQLKGTFSLDGTNGVTLKVEFPKY